MNQAKELPPEVRATLDRLSPADRASGEEAYALYQQQMRAAQEQYDAAVAPTNVARVIDVAKLMARRAQIVATQQANEERGVREIARIEAEKAALQGELERLDRLISEAYDTLSPP